MGKYLHNNAFTLVEMLLVLSVQMLIVGITVLPITDSFKQQKEKQFLQELSADIYVAQANAIVEEQDTTITFTNEKVTVHTKRFILAERAYPTTFKLQSKPINYTFAAKTGQINRFSTVQFSGNQSAEIKLIFQLGKGRFRIE